MNSVLHNTYIGYFLSTEFQIPFRSVQTSGEAETWKIDTRIKPIESSCTHPSN